LQPEEHLLMSRILSISELKDDIRDLINMPRRQHELHADLASWNTLCSALDVIGDTELALEAYASWEYRSEDGEKYLLVYGALQVMEVQQDAVKYVCQTLAVPCSCPKELASIRLIRNDAIGHAMRGKQEKVFKSSFIQRFDMTQRDFMLLTVYSDRRDYAHRRINMVELMDVQRSFLSENLRAAVDKLRSDEMAHRNKHKGEILQDLFPDSLGYLFSKITEISPLSGLHLREVKGVLLQFREALEKRGEWRKDSGAVYYYELAEYAANELENYFNPKQTRRLNEKDVLIFASFLNNQMEELRKIAKEIDHEYASAV
jgi:hypothetical protein